MDFFFTKIWILLVWSVGLVEYCIVNDVAWSVEADTEARTRQADRDQLQVTKYRAIYCVFPLF